MNIIDVYIAKEYAISKVTSHLVIDGIPALTQGKIYKILYHSIKDGHATILIKDDTGEETGWFANQFNIPLNPYSRTSIFLQ
jgi:hypothetical protein